jgi:hypothetical protein
MQFGVFDHMDGNGLPLQDYYKQRLKLIEAYDRAGFFGYHLAEHHATPLGLASSPSVFLSAVEIDFFEFFAISYRFAATSSQFYPQGTAFLLDMPDRILQSC